MTEQYTPTTDEMVAAYTFANPTGPRAEREAEAMRWLAQVKAEAKREGLEEGWGEGFAAGLDYEADYKQLKRMDLGKFFLRYPPNPHRVEQ